MVRVYLPCSLEGGRRHLEPKSLAYIWLMDRYLGTYALNKQVVPTLYFRYLKTAAEKAGKIFTPFIFLGVYLKTVAHN